MMSHPFDEDFMDCATAISMRNGAQDQRRKILRVTQPTLDAYRAYPQLVMMGDQLQRDVAHFLAMCDRHLELYVSFCGATDPIPIAGSEVREYANLLQKIREERIKLVDRNAYLAGAILQVEMPPDKPATVKNMTHEELAAFGRDVFHLKKPARQVKEETAAEEEAKVVRKREDYLRQKLAGIETPLTSSRVPGT